MALSAKALREKRPALIAEMKRLGDLASAARDAGEGHDMSAEDQANWEKVNKDYNLLMRDIGMAEAIESATAESEAPIDEQRGKPLPGRGDASGKPADPDEPEQRTTPKITAEHRALALQAWCLQHSSAAPDELSQQHRDAAKLCGINPHADQIDISLRRNYASIRKEWRDQSVVLPNAGAYLVPDSFTSAIDVAMLDFGGMRQVSQVLRTAAGEDYHWPTSNDTGNTGALINENTAVSEQDVSIARLTLRAYKYTSKLVQVPVELIEDSAIDFASFLGGLLGERLGRITNTHFTTGDGASKPKGIVTSATVGVTTASATAVTADELIGLVHSVDPAYRRGPGVGWMMHDSILLAVRKLKDGNGNYLWQPGISANEPDRLWGFPITINQDMQSSLASATRTFVFGALNYYKIRDVASVRLRRLVERYADSDQEGFVAFSRHDGGLLNAGTNPVKCILQA